MKNVIHKVERLHSDLISFTHKGKKREYILKWQIYAYTHKKRGVYMHFEKNTLKMREAHTHQKYY